MARNKKIEDVDTTITSEFIYCGLWKCPHEYCLRHHVNQPWNKVIRVRKFDVDKDWNCKHMEV